MENDPRGVETKFESSFDHDATITKTHALGEGIDHLSNYELQRGLKSRHIQYACTPRTVALSDSHTGSWLWEVPSERDCSSDLEPYYRLLAQHRCSWHT